MRQLRPSVAVLVVLSTALTGCVDLTPLREQNYRKVTLLQIETAADADDHAVFAGLVGLLEARLEEPGRIDLDHALEALASLMEQDRPEAFVTVGRCARLDPEEDVRYMSLDVLAELDPVGARRLLGDVERDDPSSLVREHASELLGQSVYIAPY